MIVPKVLLISLVATLTLISATVPASAGIWLRTEPAAGSR